MSLHELTLEAIEEEIPGLVEDYIKEETPAGLQGHLFSSRLWDLGNEILHLIAGDGAHQVGSVSSRQWELTDRLNVVISEYRQLIREELAEIIKAEKISRILNGAA
jgi:hypothetical protein